MRLLSLGLLLCLLAMPLSATEHDVDTGNKQVVCTLDVLSDEQASDLLGNIGKDVNGEQKFFVAKVTIHNNSDKKSILLDKGQYLTFDNLASNPYPKEGLLSLCNTSVKRGITRLATKSLRALGYTFFSLWGLANFAKLLYENNGKQDLTIFTKTQYAFYPGLTMFLGALLGYDIYDIIKTVNRVKEAKAKRTTLSTCTALYDPNEEVIEEASGLPPVQPVYDDLDVDYNDVDYSSNNVEHDANAQGDKIAPKKSTTIYSPQAKHYKVPASRAFEDIVLFLRPAGTTQEIFKHASMRLIYSTIERVQ